MDHACAHLATLRSYTAYWFTVGHPDDDPAFAVAACSQALVVQYDAASGHNALPIHLSLIHISEPTRPY